ncbi:MAG: ADOP family duplicated permease [Blastocatellia bacterium]
MIRQLIVVFRNLFRRSRVDRELSEEMSSYFQMLVARKIRDGGSPEEARREALIEFGGIDQVGERVREIRMGHLLETALQDLRYGGRMLVKKPGFTIVALLTLTLGIGATTAIFSVVDSVLLRPLPYPHSERLVAIQQTGIIPGNGMNISSGDYLDVQAQNHVFEQMAGSIERNFNLTVGDRAISVASYDVTTNLFSVLGAAPFIGRDFSMDDGGRAVNRGAMLGYELWRKRFGEDRNIVGRNILLDGQPFNVVGVMPRGFDFPAGAELWVAARYAVPEHPRTPDINPALTRGAHYLGTIARLKQGITIPQAYADLDTVMKQIAQATPDSDLGGSKPVIKTLHDSEVGDTRQTLLMLLGVVTLVFLIACANVANLMLARGASRQKEFAVRSALGASWLRIGCQMLTESLLLASLGGVLGIFAAVPAFGAIVSLVPGALGISAQPRLDLTVLVFTTLISLAAALLFGLAPVLQNKNTALTSSLKEGGRSSAGGRSRYQEALVAAEVALAVMLLVGAGLLMRSFVRLLGVPLGFDPNNILTMSMSLPKSAYPLAQDRDEFLKKILRVTQEVPGVSQASVVTRPPLFAGATTRSLKVDGRSYPPDSDGEIIAPDYCAVSPGYFSAMRIPLISGRWFTAEDDSKRRLVAVINSAAVRSFFPNENPIGKRINAGGEDDAWQEIVGVVGDIHQRQVGQAPRPAVYAPYSQDPWPYLTLAVRTGVEPAIVGHSVEEAIHSIDRNEAVSKVTTMDDTVAKSIASRRFNVLLVGLFATLALVLAIIGIFGVTSFAVGRRTQEMGVRIALGASRREVLVLILGRSAALTLLGAAAGTIGALLLARLISSLLF